MTDRRRIVFGGTPDFAVPALQTLAAGAPAANAELTAVLTQPDRPAGRGRTLRQSPVKQAAVALGLPVLQPPTLRDPAARQAVADLRPDLFVVVAYGLLLPQAVLDLPARGCVNVHASLLPRWRGAAPIQRAIQAGDTESGVCLMQMEAGLDTGPVLAQHRIELTPDETGGSLHDRLAIAGAELLKEALCALLAGYFLPLPQDGELATYAGKLRKQEAVIDWTASAVAIERKVRAFDPWPVAQTGYRGRQLRIWSACALPDAADAPPGTVLAGADDGALCVATGDGLLRLLKVQLAGGKAMSIDDFANAHPLAGELLVD